MELNSILTRRSFNKSSFWQIVYEWEDELSAALDLSLKLDTNVFCKYGLSRFPALANLLARSGLVFEMAGFQDHSGYNSRRCLPCIVDWYLRDEREMSVFYRQYSKNPAVLISSREAYEFLKEKDCPLRIFHWPLSLSGKYADLRLPEKRYDAVFMGRCSPTMQTWLETYERSNPGFVYVTRCNQPDGFVYVASNGDVVGRADTRQEYMDVMLKCKVGLYSTPSVDGLELKRTNGFNQVTPRFLEYVACGCHVIARYVDNPDARFYSLDSMATPVSGYEEFAVAMKKLVETPVDNVRRKIFLSQHSTADRAARLKNIMKEMA